MARIAFGTQSYQHTSLPLSAQRMVNAYLEPAPPHAKTFAAVIAACGVANHATVGDGPLRGAKRVRGINYVVSGDSLYRLSPSGVSARLGAVPGFGRVFIEGDETHLMIVDPTSLKGYYWNGSVVAEITVNWPGAIWLGYLDGYFIIIAPGSGAFYITANRNPSSIDALDFASAERAPDNLVTGIVDHAEFIAFGEETGEVFYNSGNADFPISKAPSGDFEVGCLAPFGPAKLGNTVFFPGHDGKVYQLAGYTPQVISTPVVEKAIEDATDRNFRGIVWKEPGHAFYGLACNDFAFVYDISSKLWHERESHNHAAWRWQFALRTDRQWLIGDNTSNAIGVLSADTFTEFGDVLRVECTSPPVSEDNTRISHPVVELVFEQGVGLVTGQGSDPQAMLQFSDDGGRTWSSERWRSLGAMGQYRTRTRWFRTGTARDRIYRYAMSDPVRRNLILATTKALGRAA